MMDFQREPDPEHKSVRCEKCHDEILSPPVTSEGDPYCQHCGHILGTSVMPAVWACACGETALGLIKDDDRPWCNNCNMPMSCVSAQPSRVYGVGTGDEDLEYGLAFLMDAQDLSRQVRNINELLTPAPDLPERCDGCHRVLVGDKIRRNTKKRPYCGHCGHSFDEAIYPAQWVCECGRKDFDNRPSDERPRCSFCGEPTRYYRARPSRVSCSKTEMPLLDQGLELLMEAQELGSDMI